MPNLNKSELFKIYKDKYYPSSAILDAIEKLSSDSDNKKRGAIFTRIEVVEFILDLVGYSESKLLYNECILEPSFGEGDFLLPIIDRLLSSWRINSRKYTNIVGDLGNAIRAVELHKETFISTQNKIITKLKDMGVSPSSACELANCWLVQGDFLIASLDRQFDYVVGNPPYVRQELIPDTLLAEYRLRYNTIYDRADLYIPFMEHSLSVLNKNGFLGFICSDRWMKNRYGGPLRKFISQDYHLKAYVDMVGTEAFHIKVSAYPAIIIIGKGKNSRTRIMPCPEINKRVLGKVAKDILSKALPKNSKVQEFECIINGSEPWLLESSDQVALMRRIEKQYPTIEQVGCKIGIGVATGADKAFIGNYNELDVELDRKLPLVTTRDIKTGIVDWQGQGVINPFSNDGTLVDLDKYTKLAHYLNNHKKIITKRYCAKKSPQNWYRTIDRIWPDLAKKPKLLIPDINGKAHVVYEAGKLYPHHNLYYITSEKWNLHALQAVLLSSIAKLFISMYSIKMRGGYLRFQSQYLKRICIPCWRNVSGDLQQELIKAANSRNLNACDEAVFKLYSLSKNELSALGGNGE